MGERRARLGTTKIRHLSVGSANFVGHEGRREHLRPRAAAPATRDNEGGVVCRRKWLLPPRDIEKIAGSDFA